MLVVDVPTVEEGVGEDCPPPPPICCSWCRVERAVAKALGELVNPVDVATPRGEDE